MKKIVCREDIQAELDLLSDARSQLLIMSRRINDLQREVERIKAQIPAPSINVWIPTVRTWDTTYGQSITDRADISEARLAAIDAMHEAAARDLIGATPDITQSITRDADGHVRLTWSSNSNTN